MRRSQPLVLQILLLSITWISIAGANPAAAPLLRAKLEKTVAVPGQILSLEVTILVPTWMPKPPELPTFDLPDVSVRLPEGSSRPTMERIDGETWSGVTRKYQISPMVVGHFRLPPETLTVTYADPETRAPIVVKLRTEEFVFEGRAPDGAEDLDPFIAAETLSVEQTIEGDPENLEPGLAFTRVVTARMIGASPIFLPRLIPKFQANGLAAYPKEPAFTENSNRGVTTGTRVESVTYVAEAGGRFTAAPIRLRWWNLRTQEIEVAELPALAVVSRGPPPAAVSPPVDLRDRLSRVVAGGLLVVLLGAAGRRLWPRYVERRLHRRDQKLASEAFAFEGVTKAMQRRRFGDAIRAIELWSMRLSMGADEDRGRFFEPLQPLGALFYGRSGQVPSKGDWSEALAALRRERNKCLAKSRKQRSDRVLPTLNPDATVVRRASRRDSSGRPGKEPGHS
jgi:hypothetical protein